MKKLLALVLACCFSSSSNAYDQQYFVGDVGPNGGTITNVTIESILSDTETSLQGDYLETVDTYTYTETVYETRNDTVITTELVEVITTTQSEEYTETTNEINLFEDMEGWDSSGNVRIDSGYCNTDQSNLSTGEVCFGGATQGGSTQGGGTIYSPNISIDSDMTKAELNRGFELEYGMTVTSHQSNITVPLCNATNGDCKDVFELEVKISKSTGELINSYFHSVTLDYSGARDFSWTQSIGQNDYDLGVTAYFELFGVDAGFTNDYYGPKITDPYLHVTYDVITYVTNQIVDLVETQIETIIEREFETTYKTDELVYTSEYVGSPEPIIYEVEVIDDFGEVASFEIEIIETDTGEVEVSLAVFEEGVEEIEVIAEFEAFEEIEVEVVEEVSVETIEEAVDEQDNTNDTNETQEVVEEKGSSEEESGDNVGEPVEDSESEREQPDRSEGSSEQRREKIKEAVSVKVMTALASSYNIALQNLAIASMNIGADISTYTFNLQDSVFYDDFQLEGGETYDNPLSRYFSAASDSKMDEMIMMQWKDD